MDRAYWEAVWREEEQGFHQTRINPHLQRFWSRLKLRPQARVLVPLCGKTLDMNWLLSEGHDVVGVDYSVKARDEFLASRPYPVRFSDQGDLKLAHQGSLLFVAGDVFHLRQEMLRSVDALYDRAALVALPPAARQNYVFFLAQCLRPGAQILLITRQAPEARSLPPFNISIDEVERLYACNFHIEQLHREDRQDGVIEEVFLLRRKDPAAFGRLPGDACEARHAGV
ncbi:thiopurine S-methyltransferase [Marinospirillum perlucidum]|uniref:thiopurine S-methyltransferase n=1 Tax=Marinospirillum perlucidum TaxID=1982602 RepID=UPI000DF28D22|nr:thiopurine S-methyltransferase [Marinospirillum perlucidum]